jgi:hypothetical protein
LPEWLCLLVLALWWIGLCLRCTFSSRKQPQWRHGSPVSGWRCVVGRDAIERGRGRGSFPTRLLSRKGRGQESHARWLVVAFDACHGPRCVMMWVQSLWAGERRAKSWCMAGTELPHGVCCEGVATAVPSRQKDVHACGQSVVVAPESFLPFSFPRWHPHKRALAVVVSARCALLALSCTTSWCIIQHMTRSPLCHPCELASGEATKKEGDVGRDPDEAFCRTRGRRSANVHPFSVCLFAFGTCDSTSPETAMRAAGLYIVALCT